MFGELQREGDGADGAVSSSITTEEFFGCGRTRAGELLSFGMSVSGLEKVFPECVFPVKRGDVIERSRSEFNCFRVEYFTITLVRSEEFAESFD